MKKDTALNFANPARYEPDNPDIVSVLLKIELKHRKNFFIYEGRTSAFQTEQEVLLQEGLKFKIINKEFKHHEKEKWGYYEVHLLYDDKTWKLNDKFLKSITNLIK